MGRLTITPNSISDGTYTWALDTTGTPQWSPTVGHLIRSYYTWEDCSPDACKTLGHALATATTPDLDEASAYLNTNLHTLATEFATTT